MIILKLGEILEDSASMAGVVGQIRLGAIFIYPTDTVYGLGCNAENAQSVKRLKEMKGSSHPLSVIAPSKQWIYDNLKVGFDEYLDKLPGSYTLILGKPKSFLKEACDGDKLGVRIPDSPIMKLIEQAGVPFITTSANKSGEPPAASVGELSRELSRRVEFVIDGGSLSGKPSTVIDLTGKEPAVIRD
jgi:L-threonylcarbamoyladenylate synthase